jgi:hypothetical protein
MNERIKELWEESTVSMWPRPGKFTAGEYDYHLAKFAELIVKECTTVIERNLFQGIGWNTSRAVRLHFGIEDEE